MSDNKINKEQYEKLIEKCEKIWPGIKDMELRTKMMILINGDELDNKVYETSLYITWCYKLPARKPTWAHSAGLARNVCHRTDGPAFRVLTLGSNVGNKEIWYTNGHKQEPVVYLRNKT